LTPCCHRVFFDPLGSRITTNMAHLVGLLVGLLQGWLDRNHQPDGWPCPVAETKTPPRGAAFLLADWLTA
jgi:hypothetical protein